MLRFTAVLAAVRLLHQRKVKKSRPRFEPADPRGRLTSKWLVETSDASPQLPDRAWFGPDRPIAGRLGRSRHARGRNIHLLRIADRDRGARDCGLGQPVNHRVWSNGPDLPGRQSNRVRLPYSVLNSRID